MNSWFTSKRAQVQDLGPMENKSTSNFEQGLHFQLSKVHQVVINVIFICILPHLSNPYPNVRKHKLECSSPEVGNWVFNKIKFKKNRNLSTHSQNKKSTNEMHFIFLYGNKQWEVFNVSVKSQIGTPFLQLQKFQAQGDKMNLHLYILFRSLQKISL